MMEESASDEVAEEQKKEREPQHEVEEVVDEEEEAVDEEEAGLVKNEPSETELLMMPLIASSEEPSHSVRSRSRKQLTKKGNQNKRRKRKRKHGLTDPLASGSTSNSGSASANDETPTNKRRWCPAPFVRSTLSVMNFLARLLFWSSVLAMVAAVVWYSYELKNNGTDSHLIAWFSAGAFVLLGFPISMYGIVMHLANYNQPNVQCYIVRILWMIPIYSMESWLCLRFHRFAIYIETLRDCYESYVLYSFLQFLIQVLGGEDELVLMLKDKSPTRGVHMWGLQWCVRPWLMGQPVSRTVYATLTPSSQLPPSQTQNNQNQQPQFRPVKRVSWTSPFFVRCKFGVLQYVLLKFVTSIFVMVLELNGLYKEGDFTPRGGYLYICIITNLSQCWALYCLIFFYFATHNELGPIRPVGKFLSVKAVVFFTWWQSVTISLIYQMDMIPHYSSSSESEWTSEDVAKGLQDYLICIEMFLGAIVHTFVFPHTDYLPAAVAARRLASQHTHTKRRLGRLHNKTHYGWLYRDDRSVCSKNSENACDVEMASQTTGQSDDDAAQLNPNGNKLPDSMLNNMQAPKIDEVTVEDDISKTDDTMECDEADEDGSDESVSTSGESLTETPLVERIVATSRPGFVRALLDSTIPRDVFDNSVGIVKGDYVVEKKTLLHHATTSDQYDLFANRNFKRQAKTPKEQA